MGFVEPDVWVPDLAVGVVLAIVGALLWRREDRRMGLLAFAAGLAWFAGNFKSERTTWVAWSATHLTLLHRAILFCALATFPLGRARGAAERAMIVVAYVGVLLPLPGDEEWRTIGWATCLVGFSAALMFRRPAVVRQAGYQVLPVIAVWWAVLVSVATISLVLDNSPAPRIAVWLYEAGVAVTALLLANRMSAWHRRTSEVANAVVEITYGPAGNVRDLLAQALHDPTVEIAFAASSSGVPAWVDESGRPVGPLSAGERTVVPILVGGHPVAEVASTVDIAGLPGVLAAVESATRLAAEHARLRSSVRTEIDRLAASRLRLLTAADEQRVQLAGQLERDAGNTLRRLRDVLETIAPGRDQAVDDAAIRSIDRLRSLESDLRSMAAGLGPTALIRGGLDEALHQLADDTGGCAITIAVNTAVGDIPSATANAIYFACAEGIANAVKHASATYVRVTVESTAGCWALEVIDDGCGGADLSKGSGLQSLTDRVNALAGRLRLDSSRGAGTRLTVELPCR